ncbi:MAG: pyridoxal phosphate-dependent aminotransferase [Nitriliruptoraceae bacterium]
MAISATLAINEAVAHRRQQGQPVLALGFGEAGLPVHEELKHRLSAAAGEGGYGPVAGILPLRLAAAGYFERRGLPTRCDQVVAGPGSKPLLYALLHAVGGSVALPRPSWVSYAAQATLLSQVTAMVPTPPGQGGVPDPDRLEQAVHEARAAGAPLRAVVLTLPDNPTGTLAGPEAIAAVCDVAERHDLTVISDEIYRDLIHDRDQHLVSPAQLAPERTVVTTGLSKNLALGGWRLGVARLPDGPRGAALTDRLTEIASELWSSPAQPVQHAAAWAYTEPEPLRERIDASRRLHATVAQATAARFEAMGAEVAPVAGGFYLYPDLGAHRELLRRRWDIATSDDLARVLLEDHAVATLPGTAFGDPDDRLALRVATSQLYGESDDERLAALSSPRPLELPWVAHQLERLDEALQALLGP